MKLRSLLTVAVTAAAILPGAARGAAPATDNQAVTDSVAVAVGTVLGDYIRNSVDHLASLGVQLDTDSFVATMSRVLHGQPTGMTLDEANAWIDGYIRATRPDELPDSFTVESQEQFMQQMAAAEAAVTTPSGLVFIVEQEGEGANPGPTDVVEVKYSGRFSDGTIFDATGSPITFRVDQVTPGFSEGLRMMRPGGRYRIVMPASLGYGAEGIPGAIPGNAALDFTVELLGIK